MSSFSKPCILIADDSEMNRAILTEMLESEYDIIEAENGREAIAAIETYGTDISLVLLDIVMPELDGFGVLTAMNERGWINDIPVIMISAESRSASIVRAYEMGITDFVSKPFDVSIVHHRVVNTTLLYAKQKRLIALVEEQVRENTKQSSMMVDILSHIVEFRNGESGLHVVHIRTLTELFLRHMSLKWERYAMTEKDISRYATASALHDIGKIAIPSRVLNKPGKLTNEEFAIMKTHTTVGAQMLDGLVLYRDEPLVKAAYEIARWHHERYDGRGYPDGLVGDEIPITAQIVSLADVYDALTSERVYKPPFSHDRAVEMIQNGECGAFSPDLLECLTDLSEEIRSIFATRSSSQDSEALQRVADEMLRQEEHSASVSARELAEQLKRKEQELQALRSQYDEVERIASTDLLTGLTNRAHGEALIQHRLMEDPSKEYTFLVIDLDDFKKANDVHGHQFGDRVLVDLAERLKDAAPVGAVTARFGGDEFIVFLPLSPTPQEDAQRIFEALRFDREGVRCTVSIGAVTTDVIGRDYEKLFRAADQALYAIKRSGAKDQLQFFDPATMQDIFSPGNTGKE